jgi:hypothetical protein
VVFGVRLPRALSSSFIEQTLRANAGIAGLSAAMGGLVAARAAVLAAVVAIDADMKKMVRASDACRRLMTIPGVGQLTALAFTAVVDDPERSSGCVTSAPISAWSRVAVSRAKSTIPAASPSAATGGCEPCSTRQPTSC